MRLGLTRSGWIAFRKQEMFTVHFLRKGEGRSICAQRVPYKQNFELLPRNAVICERCKPSAYPAYARSEEDKAARRPQQVPAA